MSATMIVYILMSIVVFLGIMFVIGLMYCELDNRLKKLERKDINK